MNVFRHENTVFCDVDDTLILWNPTDDQITKDGIDFKVGKVHWTFVPHKVHVDNLKKHKARGHAVVVWSAGGYEWAEIAVKLLQIEDYVDLIMAKPKWCYDDLDPHEYMPKSQWLEDK